MNQNDTSKSAFKLTNINDPFSFSDDMEFSFDQLIEEDIILLDEEITALDESIWHMDCTCPKCAKITGVEFDIAPEETSFIAICSSCSNQIHVVRESRACRAKRKTFEVACASCGNMLDNHAHCTACGELFPDYFVAIDPVAARQKARSESLSNILSSIKNLNVSIRPSFDRSVSNQTVGQYSPKRVARASAGVSRPSIRSVAIRVIFLIVAIALIVGGKFAFESYKSGQVYAENYMKVLYCVKSGVDANLKACNAVKIEWEAANASGLSFSPRINNKDEAKLAKMHGDIDNYLQIINNPPKKFLAANQSLLEIHKIYLDSEALVQTKPGSLQGLSKSIENCAKNMDQASQKLKSTLPDSLQTELATAKLKYRSLKDF